MVGVGRDLCGSSSPTLLPKQGHPEQAVEDLVQAGLEYLQRRRLHHLPGQPGSGLRHPQREEVGLKLTQLSASPPRPLSPLSSLREAGLDFIIFFSKGERDGSVLLALGPDAFWHLGTCRPPLWVLSSPQPAAPGCELVPSELSAPGSGSLRVGNFAAVGSAFL